MRQLFRRDFEPDETAVVISEVTAVLEGAQNRTVKGWVAATDRALHLRFLVGADLQRGMRVGYDEIKHVELSGPDDAHVHITYFAPHQVTSTVWYQHLHLRDLTAPGFAATLEEQVGPRMPETPAEQDTAASQPAPVPNPTAVPSPTAAPSPAVTPVPATAARAASHVGRLARRRPGRHRRGAAAAH